MTSLPYNHGTEQVRGAKRRSASPCGTTGIPDPGLQPRSPLPRGVCSALSGHSTLPTPAHPPCFAQPTKQSYWANSALRCS